jgi:hypothetical protein
VYTTGKLTRDPTKPGAACYLIWQTTQLARLPATAATCLIRKIPVNWAVSKRSRSGYTPATPSSITPWNAAT